MASLGGLGAGTEAVYLGELPSDQGNSGEAGEAQTVDVYAGPASALPESSEGGRLYIAVDTGERFYDTGTEWQSLDIAAPNASIGIYELEFKPLQRSFDSRDRWQFGGWLKDNFDDLSEWSAMDGSVTVDTGTAYVGEQSAKLRTLASHGSRGRSSRPTLPTTTCRSRRSWTRPRVASKLFSATATATT